LNQNIHVITAPVITRIIDSSRDEMGLFLEEDDWAEKAKKEKALTVTSLIKIYVLFTRWDFSRM